MAKGEKRYRKLGKALIAERCKAGITQKQLAELLGWEQSKIVRIEKGEQRIDIVEFLDLAAAVGLDPAAFISALKASR